MNPNDTTELLKIASGFGLVGIVAVTLGLRFLKSAEKREDKMQEIADEDRKWIREQGEQNMILMSSMLEAINLSTSTNKALTDTNTKLVAILEKAR